MPVSIHKPPAPSQLPLKYREARRVLPYSGAFVADNKAATLYAALERVGWRWNGATWEHASDEASEGGE